MSATNRGSILISQEFYPTPQTATQSILKEIDMSKVNTFTEPCRGEGHIYDLVTGPYKHYCELSEGTDYLLTQMPQVDLILTNPPFSLAEAFIIKALKEAGTVIMLQRVNFLGSQARKAFWNANPPTHLFVLANRPKFVATCTNKLVDSNNKRICTDKHSYQITTPATPCISCGSLTRPTSDATEYAWFCWDRAGLILKSPGVYVL